MTEKSRLITGIEKGEIIKSSNNYFTEIEKRQTVEEYLNTDSSKIQIWRTHTAKDLLGQAIYPVYTQYVYLIVKPYQTHIK